MIRTRNFIAAVLSAAVLVTGGSAAPAKAQMSNDDIVRILGGLAAVGIISKVVKDEKERREDEARREDRRDEARRRAARNRVPEYRQVPDRHRPIYGSRNNIIPSQCVFAAKSRGITSRFVGQGCVQQNTRHRVNLPRQCHDQIRIRGDRRDVYRVPCLRQSGYRFEARR